MSNIKKYILLFVLNLFCLVALFYLIIFIFVSDHSISNFSQILSQRDIYQYIIKTTNPGSAYRLYNNLIRINSLAIPLMTILFSYLYFRVSLDIFHSYKILVYISHFLIYGILAILSIMLYAWIGNIYHMPVFGEDVSAINVIAYSVVGLIIYLVISGIKTIKKKKE